MNNMRGVQRIAGARSIFSNANADFNVNMRRNRGNSRNMNAGGGRRYANSNRMPRAYTGNSGG